MAAPADFRFVVKAQRGGSVRAWQAAGDGPPDLAWLTAPYRLFGERLGAVLFRIPADVPLGDDGLIRLDRLLGAWPADLPLVVECQDPSWEVDEVLGRLRAAGAAWCTTELDGADTPSIHRTGSFLHLRLRRVDYAADEIGAWADRIVPFLEGGLDATAVFRHDEVGRGPELAMGLAAAVRARLG